MNEKTDSQETFTIDRESFDRLAKGTPFQRSTNLLEMLLLMAGEITEDAVKRWKLSKTDADSFRAKERKDHLKMLLKNPPYGIDRDALKAFCE
jgi:hypothetical protein